MHGGKGKPFLDGWKELQRRGSLISSSILSRLYFEESIEKQVLGTKVFDSNKFRPLFLGGCLPKSYSFHPCKKKDPFSSVGYLIISGV
jgi:hypothetical protein